MEETKFRFKITNKKQFNFMVRFMENNTDITRGACHSTDKELFLRKWDQLTNELNQLGPPCRDYKGWEKVWRDYKLKIKKKIAHNTKEKEIFLEGRYNKLFSISPLEESVIVLLDLDKTTTTATTTSKFEIPAAAEENISSNIFVDEIHIKDELVDDFDVYHVNDNEENPYENDENIKRQLLHASRDENVKSKKNKINDEHERQTLLKKQTENMNKIVENTREIARCLRNIEKTKFDKLILYEKELEAKRKYREEKTLWRNELLEYKKQKLLAIKQEVMPD